MVRIKSFKTQHSEIMELANQISARLTPAEIERDPQSIRSLLSQLSGKLSVHLSMEDQTLYPLLMSHPDDRIKEMSRSFSNEMGGILSVYRQYKSKWPTHMEISASPDEFIRETKQIFSVLAERIDKEDNQLYPLIES
jgi:hemerythrin-like domain-containing protein